MLWLITGDLEEAWPPPFPRHSLESDCIELFLSPASDHPLEQIDAVT